jgi:hypothetical protein
MIEGKVATILMIKRKSSRNKRKLHKLSKRKKKKKNMVIVQSDGIKILSLGAKRLIKKYIKIQN